MANVQQKALPTYAKWLVWALRLLVGGTFIFAGFVKCIDPWGFIYKIEDYLQVWHIHWVWRELVLCTAVGIATVEFCTGFAVLTGCLRRVSCWVVALMMIFMLPLTAYIALANPVPDCGCFGDVLIISNTATFIKNVLLTIATIYLLKYNAKVAGLYPPISQAFPMILGVVYCIIISAVGITIQPLIDFRQYKVGTDLLDESLPDIRLIYEKDGEQRSYALDNLPDSTWTYIGREAVDLPDQRSAFAVYDGDEEVTDEVISTSGPQLLLVVTDAKSHSKSRASMANNVNDYIDMQGGSMIGIVSANQEGLRRWRANAAPKFDVYTADDTTLKTLVRGTAGLVYLVDGKIVWKRNIYSLAGDFPDYEAQGDQLDEVYAVDNGRPISYITGVYLAALLVLGLLGLIRIKNDAKTTEKDSK